MFHRALLLLWSLCCWGALAVNENYREPFGLRLVDGGGRCQGRLQVQIWGQDWADVWPQEVPLWLGQRLCAELDCGAPLSMKRTTAPKKSASFTTSSRVARRRTVDIGTKCEDTSLIHCFGSHQSDRTKSRLELSCSDSVRLVSGRTSCSGSLQIRDQSLDRSWTSVCEGALDRRGAEVLCRELGCGAPLLQGVPSRLGQTFHCEGHESALLDCPRNQTRTDPETCPGPAQHLTCSEPVRLVGGARRCEGTVEVRFGGEWRPVVEPWTLEAAAVVCRDLDCGSAVSADERKGLELSDVWKVRPECAKTKAAVRDCVSDDSSSSALELVCSDSVRLVSGRSLCSGSLQIRDQSSDRSWTSVCEGALDRRGAEVLCRELGCGAPLLQGALSPLGRTFHCEGHESALMDCPRNQTRTDPGTCPAQLLTCSEPLRLVGGANRCEGTVEVRFRGQWRRSHFQSTKMDQEFMVAVCQALDCGTALSVAGTRDYIKTDVWHVSSRCVKNKAALKDCVFGGSLNQTSVGLKVVCSDSVRLVSGRSLCSGSLQIRALDRSWTSVCEGALDRRGAEVLCRELGCGAPLLQGALSPLGQTFHCEGHESALMDCPRNQTRTEPGTCSTLHLTCSEPVRLVGGASRCEGMLEIMHRGSWKPVEPWTSRDSWNLMGADAVCRGLHCGSAVSVVSRRGLNMTDMCRVEMECVINAALRGCIQDVDFPYGVHVEVVCSDSVRLVSGKNLCSGSLQIRDQSSDLSWTSVCEGALDRRGAEVLCRELGCGAPLLQGALSPLGRTFHCEGHESALMDCPRNQTRTDPGTCSGPALNLTCSEPVRLVGGSSRCEGTVEMLHAGEWRRVVGILGTWTLKSAASVCRGLGCGSVFSLEEQRCLNKAKMWVVNMACAEREASLRDCVEDGYFRREGLGVVCSEHPGRPTVSQGSTDCVDECREGSLLCNLYAILHAWILPFSKR